MREKRQRSLKINVETDLRKIVNKALALGKNRRDMNERPLTQRVIMTHMNQGRREN
jgi:hypothetical protein